MNRRTAREKALQILFQYDVGKIDLKDAYRHVLGDEADDSFLKTIVFGTVEHMEEIDEIIKNHLEKWSFGRLANVDRTILRLAVYEMKYMDDIPENVTINEAVEIAKRFGDENSGRFINGVLSNIKESIDAEKTKE